MSARAMACNFFLKIKLDWKCCGIDANGMSRGLIVGWNLLWNDLCPFHTFAGILIEIRMKGI